jgi:hypothetical protein
VAHRLVQQHAVPAGAQHHVHLTGRAGDGVQVDERLAQRLLGLLLPALGRDPGLEPGPAARAGIAALALALALDCQLDVDAGQRAHVADQPAVGAQDLHRPPLAGQRGHHLHDPRVAGAAPGVDLLQQGDLVGEVGRGQRIVVAIEAGVGGPRRLGRHAGIAALGQGGRIGGVGVAGGLAGHHAQAESFGGVIGRRFQPAVVIEEALALRALDEQLAVVGALERLAQQLAGPLGVDAGGFEDGGGRGDRVHAGKIGSRPPRVTRRLALARGPGEVRAAGFPTPNVSR